MQNTDLKSLYVQEIRELTELLDNEWHDLRERLKSAHINLDGARLVGFVEGEDCSEYGALVLADGSVVSFDSQGGTFRVTHEKSDGKIFEDFPQIAVALNS